MCFPLLFIFVLSLSEGFSGWPQSHGSLLAYLWCRNYNVCVIVLVKVSVAVKGHHEHGNSYNGVAHSYRGLDHYHYSVSWQHTGRHDSRARKGADISTS